MLVLNHSKGALRILTLSSLLGVGFHVCMVSCGRSQASHQHEGIRQVFLHGNPLNLISGTKQNTETFFNINTLQSFQNFDFAGGVVFSEFSPLHRGKGAPNTNNIEAENATNYHPAEMSSFSFQNSKQANHDVYEYYDKVTGQTLFKALSDNAGKIWVYEILGLQTEVLHYSISKDMKTFSLLGKAKSETSGQMLLSIAFTSSETINTPPNSSVSSHSPAGTASIHESEPLAAPSENAKQYSFLGGPGIKFKWQQEVIGLNFCNTSNEQTRTALSENGNQETLISLTERAWQAWQIDGRTGSKISTFQLIEKDPPPFSDVNTNCIYSVPAYAQEASLEFVTTGLTLPVTSRANGHILSSQIFLFEQAISRVGKERGYLSTAVHEIGHFLGLGHEFTKDPLGNYKNLSVMGYLGNRTLLPTDFDFAALDELYR